MEIERLIRPVEAARQGEFDFEADLSKKEGFSLKKCSDRAQVHLFAVDMCQNHVLDNCCGTPFCIETALVCHCSASNFLTYFSLVAGLLPVFVTSHTYCIFFLSVTMSPP